MNYLEINLLNENDYCSKLYKKIIKDFNYDLVIFVAKGGYSLGKNMALLNDCDFLEVIAERKGNKLKQKIKPLFKFLPKKLTVFIREKELKSGMHSKHSERKIQFNEKAYSRYKDKINNVLIIDDSVDTGNTVNITLNLIRGYFKKANVKFASLNVMKKSNIYPDYYLFEDTIIKGPWSSDSQENELFLKEYYEWHNNLK